MPAPRKAVQLREVKGKGSPDRPKSGDSNITVSSGKCKLDVTAFKNRNWMGALSFFFFFFLFFIKRAYMQKYRHSSRNYFVNTDPAI